MMSKKGNEHPMEVSARAREGVERVLCDYFASDSLSVEELEKRLDRTHRASSLHELRAVLSDLPRGDDRFDALVRNRTRESRSADPSDRPPTSRELRRYEESRNDNDLALAIFGGSARRGRWLPARRTTALALCGGVDLDFRDVVLPPGVTEIQVLAIMGGVEIVVAPGTAVDARGLAVMGGFDHVDDSLENATDPDRPVLRVRGMAVMGAIDISVRRPGETAREARRRKRRERHDRRAADPRSSP